MSDLISREDLKKLVISQTSIAEVWENTKILSKVLDIIDNAPAVEPEKGDLIKRNLAISHATSGLVRRIDGEDWIRTSEVRQSLNDVPSEPQVTVWAENASKEEIEDFKQELENVLERTQGEWIDTDSEWLDYKCNKCGWRSTRKHNFCPNCGVKTGNPNE